VRSAGQTAQLARPPLPCPNFQIAKFAGIPGASARLGPSRIRRQRPGWGRGQRPAGAVEDPQAAPWLGPGPAPGWGRRGSAGSALAGAGASARLGPSRIRRQRPAGVSEAARRPDRPSCAILGGRIPGAGAVYVIPPCSLAV
jgi:hypothetical protein